MSHECGSVDHTGLHFAENISLKLLRSGLDTGQELGSGGQKLAGRKCRCKPRKQSEENTKKFISLMNPTL